jgi:hypothetical protein
MLTRWEPPGPVHHRAKSIAARSLARVGRSRRSQQPRVAPGRKPYHRPRAARAGAELPPPLRPHAPWLAGERLWSLPPWRRLDAGYDKSRDRSPLSSQCMCFSSGHKTLPPGTAAASPGRRNSGLSLGRLSASERDKSYSYLPNTLCKVVPDKSVIKRAQYNLPPLL